MRARILTLFALLWLAGCSSVPSLLYKIEIQQGNVITQEMVDKLKPGMTKSQVRFALGSPMISDAFHENRWDYLYRFDQRGRLIEQKNLVVLFEDDKLVRIAGSFATPAAFLQPLPAEPTEPARVAEPMPPVGSVESDRQLTEEAGEERAAPVPEGGVPEGIAAPADVGDIPAAAGAVPAVAAPVASGSAPVPDGNSGSAVGQPSAQPMPQPGPRLAPSQATDTGVGGADQLKE